jgi:hypothetical protein
MDKMSSIWMGTCATLSVVALLAFAAAAYGVPLTFCNVCDGARFVQKGEDLQIICPGQTTPFFTFKGCTKPKVKKDKAGNVTITCNG